MQYIIFLKFLRIKAFIYFLEKSIALNETTKIKFYFNWLIISGKIEYNIKKPLRFQKPERFGNVRF